MGKKIEFTPKWKLTVDHGIVRAGHPHPEAEVSSQGGQEDPTLERALCTSLAVGLGLFSCKGMGECINALAPS